MVHKTRLIIIINAIRESVKSWSHWIYRMLSRHGWGFYPLENYRGRRETAICWTSRNYGFVRLFFIFQIASHCQHNHTDRNRNLIHISVYIENWSEIAIFNTPAAVLIFSSFSFFFSAEGKENSVAEVLLTVDGDVEEELEHCMLGACYGSDI